MRWYIDISHICDEIHEYIANTFDSNSWEINPSHVYQNCSCHIFMNSLNTLKSFWEIFVLSYLETTIVISQMSIQYYMIQKEIQFQTKVGFYTWAWGVKKPLPRECVPNNIL